MHYNYAITPKIVEVEKETSFQIRPRYNTTVLKPGMQIKLQIISKRDCRIQRTYDLSVDEKEGLLFKYRAISAGEYTVYVYPPEFGWPDRVAILLGSSFFALHAQMMNRRPYRGDFHLHTFYDGPDGVSPACMAARAREAGMDYAAITEHGYYDASLEAIREADEHGFDILLFPGEEIGFATGIGHILSINAATSIDDQIRPFINKENLQTLTQGLEPLVKSDLPDRKLPPAVQPEFFAFIAATVNRIREAGGFAIIAHPLWTTRGVFHLIRSTYEQILKEKLYDAIEIIGGCELEDNILSVSKYGEMQSSGKQIPIVGSSDAHRPYDHGLGDMWTLCFSERLDRDSVLEAIAGANSVACLRLDRATTLIFGPFDLVEYAYFLEREFFPLHDEYCRLLGKLYQLELEQENYSVETKTSLREKIKELYVRYWSQD